MLQDEKNCLKCDMLRKKTVSLLEEEKEVDKSVRMDSVLCIRSKQKLFLPYLQVIYEQQAGIMSYFIYIMAQQSLRWQFHLDRFQQINLLFGVTSISRQMECHEIQITENLCNKRKLKDRAVLPDDNPRHVTMFLFGVPVIQGV